MKFKVGDRVRLLDNEWLQGYDTPPPEVGEIGTVKDLNNYDFGYYSVNFENGSGWCVSKQFLEPECCVNDLAELYHASKRDPFSCCLESNEGRECVCKSTEEVKESLFKKFDNKKPRTDLLHPEFLLELAKVLGKGAEKYGDTNYKNCDNPDRYYAAALRHLFAYKMGQTIDEETKTSHLSNATANLMFMFELENRK